MGTDRLYSTVGESSGIGIQISAVMQSLCNTLILHLQSPVFLIYEVFGGADIRREPGQLELALSLCRDRCPGHDPHPLHGLLIDFSSFSGCRASFVALEPGPRLTMGWNICGWLDASYWWDGLRLT